MSPDDPRHGTTAGHSAGCRCLPCGTAKLRYDKKRKYERTKGIERLVDPVGTRRRIRALQALGHSAPDIAMASGLSARTVNGICTRGERITAPIAKTVADTYEAMCMTPAKGPLAGRQRRRARRAGWPPPLAWDDIDNDPEPQYGGTGADLDPVIVMRLLEGRRVKANRAEREEAIRRWVEDGGTKTELCNIHGWEPGRYMVETRLRLVRGGAA